MSCILQIGKSFNELFHTAYIKKPRAVSKSRSSYLYHNSFLFCHIYHFHHVLIVIFR